MLVLLQRFVFAGKKFALEYLIKSDMEYTHKKTHLIRDEEQM